jgi:predicted pyridoxine 5'-phosphate oxidase superfamily flavin-nucleotide-binding protein
LQNIPESVKKFLNSQKLGYVATISDDNTPNLSPKGTIISWDDQLAFADIRSPNTMKNLESNPHLEINVIDPLLRKGFRFKGKGNIIKDGPVYGAILSHYRQNGVKSPIGSIVLVDVIEFSEVTSPLYDLGVTEDEMKEKWKKNLLGL